MIYYINNNIYAVSADSLDYFLEESYKIRSSRKVIVINSIGDIRKLDGTNIKCVLSFKDEDLLNDVVFSYIKQICEQLDIDNTTMYSILSTIGVSQNAEIIETFKYQLDDASFISYEILLQATFSTDNPKIESLLRDKMMNAIPKIERDAVEDQLLTNKKQLNILMKQNPQLRSVIEGISVDKVKFVTLNRAINACVKDIESDPRLFSFVDFNVTADLIKALKSGGDFKSLLPNTFNGLCNYFGKRAFRINNIVL